MNWFKYIWIVFLIIAYLIWTIKCIIDFIEDKRSMWKLSYRRVTNENRRRNNRAFNLCFIP